MVGEECLKQLLASPEYSSIVALTRKSLPVKHPKVHNLVVDFEYLDRYVSQIKADHIYCALGTTISKAGSQEAFRKVDYEYPLKVAEMAQWEGTQKFILVSSIGADPNSSVFYSRVKGELEEALKKLKFKSLIIFRPSILLGDRKERRTGEEIGRFVAEKLPFIFSGPLKKYRGTPADLLAAQMVKMGVKDAKGIRIIENNEIFDLAE